MKAIYIPEIPMSMWAEDDIPHNKLLFKGSAALSDSEMLSIVIGYDTKRFSSLLFAQRLLRVCDNDLLSVAKLSVSEIMKEGATRDIAVRIVAAFQLGKRRQFGETALKERVTTSRCAFEKFEPLFGDSPYEQFWGIFLNRYNRVVSIEKISEGGISGTVVDPKKIFKIALDKYAVAIILAHNHPSGNLRPSETDEALTKRLVTAGRTIEINIIDHLILAGSEYYSFADNGNI